MTVQDIARRAAFDAQALGGGMMRTIDTESVFEPQRLALARQALSIAGGIGQTFDPEDIARRMVPVVRDLVLRGAIK